MRNIGGQQGQACQGQRCHEVGAAGDHFIEQTVEPGLAAVVGGQFAARDVVEVLQRSVMLEFGHIMVSTKDLNCIAFQ